VQQGLELKGRAGSWPSTEAAIGWLLSPMSSTPANRRARRVPELRNAKYRAKSTFDGIGGLFSWVGQYFDDRPGLGLEENGGPGRTRTCNQTVMSGRRKTKSAENQRTSMKAGAFCSLSVHPNDWGFIGAGPQ